MSQVAACLLLLGTSILWASASGAITVVSYPQQTICEGGSISMQCPKGYDIGVNSAFFGRVDNTTCVTDNVTDDVDVNCDVTGVYDKLKSLCEYKESCTVAASTTVFGEVEGCEGNYSMYLQAAYSCYEISYGGIACEGMGALPLSCPEGLIVDVIQADYGRKGGDSYICPADSVTADNSQCLANMSTTIAQELCNEKNSCYLDPRDYVFGDPCPEQYKYLEVYYGCIECVNELAKYDALGDTKCNMWAFKGNCSDNANWMIVNCRAACGSCTTVELPCVNQNEYCDYWADLGECETNPSYMMFYCRKACLNCEGYAECDTKADNATSCDMHADNGLCTSMDVGTFETMYELESDFEYMLGSCGSQCFDCPPGGVIACEDKMVNCTALAMSGECNANPGMMLTQCAKSCTGCDTDYMVCENRLGDDYACEAKAEVGECSSNPQWMYTNCWKTCTNCYGRETCINSHESDLSCKSWRTSGDCYSNTAWMMDECFAACTQCLPEETQNQLMLAEAEMTECVNNIGDTMPKAMSDAQCGYWAMEGECASNPGYMVSNCSRACGYCEPDTPLECVNVDVDSDCESWKSFGFCSTNPKYMINYCRKSCTNCDNLSECDTKAATAEYCTSQFCSDDAVNMLSQCTSGCFGCPEKDYVPCINQYDISNNATECVGWANRGSSAAESECYVNPAFMMTLCTQACLYCDTEYVVCENAAGDDVCAAYPEDACSTDAGYMYRFCWKRCTACQGEPECVNIEDDVICEAQRHMGYCDDPDTRDVMLQQCWKSCSLCMLEEEEAFTPSAECVNAYDNDEACNRWRDNGYCFTNPLYMLPNCYKACTWCESSWLNPVYFGNLPIPGNKDNVIRKDSTFILPPESTEFGKLTHFAIYFVTPDPIVIQIYHPSNEQATEFELVYEKQVNATNLYSSETFLADGKCVYLHPGDRIGFTTITDMMPIGTTFSLPSGNQVTYYKRLSTGMLHLTWPYRYSIGAFFDKDTICGI